MRLLVCDNKRIQYFEIPEKVENYFVINCKYFYDNNYYDELLTLVSAEDKWQIVSNDKLKVVQNGQELSNILLQDNVSFGLMFANLPEVVNVFVVPAFSNFYPYSLKDLNKIVVGSSSDSNIKYLSDNEYSVEIVTNNNEFYVQRKSMPISLTYLNSKVYSVHKILAGDVLFVNGIRIIFMKNYILVDPFNYKLEVSLDSVDFINNNLDSITPVNELEKNIKLFTEEQLFIHSPRIRTEIKDEVIEVEAPPASEKIEEPPVIFTLISSSAIFATSGLTLISSLRNYSKGQTEFFAFVMELAAAGIMLVSSVLLPIFTEKWSKYHANKNEKLRKKKYLNYLKEKKKIINDIIKRQEGILRLNNTSLEQIISNILSGNSEIWSRQIFDNDFLNISVGLGNLPANIKVEVPPDNFSVKKDPLKEEAINLAKDELNLVNVPVTFSLLTNNIMPIVLNMKDMNDYIKSILLQVIYYHSGNDLKIVTITSKENEPKWEFMKFLPHSWDSKHEKRLFVTSESELLQVSSFLEQEYENRKNTSVSNSDKDKYLSFSEYYLIVTDNYKLAREMSVVSKILEENEKLGISMIVFAPSFKDLPSRFNVLVNISDNEGTIVNRDTKINDRISFKPSYIANLDMEKYVSVLSNIPVSVGSSDSKIPTSVTFLEMFNAGRVDQLNVLSRWKNNNPVASLKAIIGFRENNNEVELDLHEKYHGPHGLIAGTTGSGKSEFIISYILSLAVNYHPYEVQFVLIDYKGGGLAGAFENRETGLRLPHLVGTITNLDKSEMNRTLVSIKSELQRRQRVFNETRDSLDEGTIDIYKYQRLYRDGKVTNPMAHLFIISDEFAELKAQQPDFMNELISAARIGRSLGIHLILATQKPSGVVDDQIWSNSRFKVCLKVQTPEDSNEMLKKPDAAYIKESGRFYLQVGNDEIYELGQSGWSGAKYIPSSMINRKVDDSISFLANNGEVIKTINEEVKKEELQEQGEQLTNVVKYLHDLAVRENLKESNLWLPNIPEEIYYDDIIKKYNIKSTRYFIDPIIGEYDDPANQKQGYVDLPLSECGNTFITGISGSGKSTLLSTIIYSTIINHNASAVNIYVIDFGAEKLKIFSKAPQVGEVLTANDTDKINFLFYMLKEERDMRFSYYSQNGGDFYKDLKNEKNSFPTILVIINEIDIFKEQFENLYEEEFVQLTRNCFKVGIIFIVTSTLVGSLGYMAEGNFMKNIAMNLNDTTDYNTYFKSYPIPKRNPGRGVIEMDDVYEFQTSLIFNDTEYDSKVNYIVSQLNKYLPQKARRVPVIPDEVSIEWLQKRIKGLSNLPLGVNIKTAQIGTFNFDNILSIMSSLDISAAKKFFPKFFEILSFVNNYKIIVINSIEDFKFSVPDSIKYVDGSFKKTISTINENVNKCINEKKDVNYLVVFVGYSKLQKHLLKSQEEDESVVTIDDLIINSKKISNFRYILYDVCGQLNFLDDSKLDSCYKRNNAVWIGKGFDEQSIIETSQYYNSEGITNNNIVVVKNGKAEFLKY